MSHEYHIVGIGCGPANLSLAALLATAQNRGATSSNWAIFESRSSFDWHPGQLLPRSLMQSEWYRDLVSPIDPTSEYSFLNFLKNQGRLFRFINAGIVLPERAEFNEYLKWVASKLPTLHFEHRCSNVLYSKEHRNFLVEFLLASGARTEIRCRNLVVGVGNIPHVPAGIELIKNHVCHVSSLLTDSGRKKATNVLVVGGGQSGAEAFLYFLEQSGLACRDISWITHDTSFRILDTGHFAREFYSSSFAHRFHALSADSRACLRQAEIGAGEGISPSVAEEIYRSLYRLEYDQTHFEPKAVRIAALKSLKAVKQDGMKVVATIKDDVTGIEYPHLYDYVVLCTGFDPAPLDFLKNLFSNPDEECSLASSDYSLDNARFPACRLYVQSRCEPSHGLGDPNLVVSAGRCATILNSIEGRDLFQVPTTDSFLNW